MVTSSRWDNWSLPAAPDPSVDSYTWKVVVVEWTGISTVRGS